MSARPAGEGRAELREPSDGCDPSTSRGPVLVINAALFAGAVGNYASSRLDVTVPAGVAGGSVSTSHGAMVLVALDSLVRQIEALHAGTAATRAQDTAARHSDRPASAAEEVRP
jgi:hypothetical protein